MIELFHPVSGEPLICFTEAEKPLIKLALEELQYKTSSHNTVSGVAEW